jgi:hypothetical protein
MRNGEGGGGVVRRQGLRRFAFHGSPLRIRTAVATTVLVLLPSVPALGQDGSGTGALHAQPVAAPFRADLALRPGYHGIWRTGRDGATSEVHDLRTRVQLGGWWTPDPVWAVRARVAGRLSTEQEAVRFVVRDHVPTTDGLQQGEFTLDEAYLRWRPGDRFQLRAGRMQTSFELAGVARKSLDRNDSPNTDISWTDGLHASARVHGGWRQHLIVQHNGDRGPTNVVRRPLDVSGPGSRATVFTSAQLEGRWGPFVQRELDLTWLPRASPVAAMGAGLEDYIALVARGALQPSLRVLGGRTLIGVELGAAAGAPSRESLGTGSAADGAGRALAGQISANLMEVGGRHSLGVVLSRTGDAWLISPDIRENNTEFEARYYWQYATWGRLDVRFRDRQDLRLRPASIQRRHDRDVYVRTTLRF